MGVINETVKSFFQQHNYGKAGTKDFMVHCRPSVEKYVFSRLYDRLYAMYKARNQELDHEYMQKRMQTNSMTRDDLRKALKVMQTCTIIVRR